MTEYVLVLALAVWAATRMGRVFLQAVDTGILTLGGQLEKDLKTGRAVPNVYVN